MRGIHRGRLRSWLSRSPKRVWVQDVDVSAALLEAQLHGLAAARDSLAERLARSRRPLARRRLERLEAERKIEVEVRVLLRRARHAAHRKKPVPNRFLNWWDGRLIEASYRNLHAAEALIVELYDMDRLLAEAPEAIARVEAGLDRDDPRVEAARSLLARLPSTPLPSARAEMFKTIEVGHGAADHSHSRLRGFRNALLGGALVIALLLLLFVAYVWAHPQKVPLCFSPSIENSQATAWVCPTGQTAPPGSPEHSIARGSTDQHDVLVVALLGLLGGAFSAAVALRNLNVSATPYDVSLALAALKLPLGALTAIGGLIALQGDFIPGLSQLDSQGQILAYALILGYAQQLLTGLLDRRADQLLADVPGKARGRGGARPMAPPRPPPTSRPARRHRRRGTSTS